MVQGTVSLALRDDPRIPIARRAEIRTAAKKMGYRPNSTATTLAHLKWNVTAKPAQSTLAWLNLWPQPESLRRLKEFDGYWRGAAAMAEHYGYRLEEFTPVKSSLSMPRLQQVLTARGIQGILLPPHSVHPNWGDFDWNLFSVVRFGRSLTHPATHMVTADQVANMILAFEEIRRRGYRRIGFVAEPPSKNWFLFEAGFLMAQQKVEAGLRLPIFRLAEGTPLNSQEALDRWLEKEKPDAVVTTIAETAEMLQKTSYRAPAKIGLAAMSVLDGKADTGIHQNPEEIGRAGIETLVGLIHGNIRGIPDHPHDILVHGRWVDGDSLRPLDTRRSLAGDPKPAAIPTPPKGPGTGVFPSNRQTRKILP